MPTVSSYGSGFTSTGWTSTTNAHDSNLSTFASLTTATSGANTTYITGYNFGSTIPSGYNYRVSFTVAQYTTTPSNRWNAPSIRPYVSTTPISTSQTLLESSTSTNQEIVIRTDITYAQITDPNFQVQFIANKNGTVSATQYLGGILVTVEYYKESWGVLDL